MSKKEFIVTILICGLLALVLMIATLALFGVAVFLLEKALQTNNPIETINQYHSTIRPLFIAAMLCFFNISLPVMYITDLVTNVTKVSIKEVNEEE